MDKAAVEAVEAAIWAMDSEAKKGLRIASAREIAETAIKAYEQHLEAKMLAADKAPEIPPPRIRATRNELHEAVLRHDEGKADG